MTLTTRKGRNWVWERKQQKCLFMKLSDAKVIILIKKLVEVCRERERRCINVFTMQIKGREMNIAGEMQTTSSSSSEDGKVESIKTLILQNDFSAKLRMCHFSRQYKECDLMVQVKCFLYLDLSLSRIRVCIMKIACGTFLWFFISLSASHNNLYISRDMSCSTSPLNFCTINNNSRRHGNAKHKSHIKTQHKKREN
jgi:hypothetical protein